MAMKARLLFWTQATAFLSFLPIHPGSWFVPTLGQLRFVRPRLQHVTCLSYRLHSPTRISASCDVPTDLGPVLAFSAGDYHSCAVRTDGQLVCFGDNEFGQCDVPADLGPVFAVSAGEAHSCAERTDGQLVCFGGNEYGQCDVPADLGPVLAVSAGTSNTCAVRTYGQLVCFADYHHGGCADLGTVLAVSAGDYHTCDRRSALLRWGQREWGV